MHVQVLTHFSGRYKTGGRKGVGADNTVEANSNTQVRHPLLLRTVSKHTQKIPHLTRRAGI